MRYNHLFFDLDHTLWDFDANAKATLVEIYHSFELERKGVLPFDTFYNHYKVHNDILWSKYHKGAITGEELKWKRMYRTLLEFKIANETLSKKMSEHFMELLPTKKLLFPNTLKILDYLTEKKYDMHLITNGFEKTQWMKLSNSGLDKYFTHMVTSEKSNSLKPHKEIFEYALNLVGASLSESIMLGDNLEVDIQGAINFGMDNVFVNHINATTNIKPTYIVTHLDELKQFL